MSSALWALGLMGAPYTVQFTWVTGVVNLRISLLEEQEDDDDAVHDNLDIRRDMIVIKDFDYDQIWSICEAVD